MEKVWKYGESNEVNLITFLERYSKKLEAIKGMVDRNEHKWIKFLIRLIKDKIREEGKNMDPENLQLIIEYREKIQDQLETKVNLNSKWVDYQKYNDIIQKNNKSLKKGHS